MFMHNIYIYLHIIGARYIMDWSGDLYGVVDFHIHADYNKTVIFSNDIAIVVADKHLKLGIKAQRALIVSSSKWMDELYENFETIGWGWTQVSRYQFSRNNIGII